MRRAKAVGLSLLVGTAVLGLLMYLGSILNSAVFPKPTVENSKSYYEIALKAGFGSKIGRVASYINGDLSFAMFLKIDADIETDERVVVSLVRSGVEKVYEIRANKSFVLVVGSTSEAESGRARIAALRYVLGPK